MLLSVWIEHMHNSLEYVPDLRKKPKVWKEKLQKMLQSVAQYFGLG